ncbi:sensor histidine kinase [Jiella flava]|uniref:sensor histidine kinase n=1 Tax=Jiella flava TaxID=2816857 RepID=UPI0031B81B31
MATGQDEAFDRITRLATRMLGVSASYISLFDGERQVFKSEIGLPKGEARDANGLRVTGRSESLCRFVVDSGEAVISNDVAHDPRFAASPSAPALKIGAYMGMPVSLPDGSVVGSFCAVDSAPRQWSQSEREGLEELLAMLAAELVLRQEVKQRKRLEQHAFLMSREMEHRIKNSLSTVQAIILLSVREGQTPSEIRVDLLERVASLAKTQSLLADRDGKGALFADIVTAELQHFGIGTNVWIDGPEVVVGKDDAVSVSMIIHELATNATKHGALSPKVKGGVAMRWENSEREAHAALTFHWQEWFGAEPPPVAANTANGLGFGTELLETLVLRQMRGEMSREMIPGGFLFTATVRLNEKAA